MANAWGNSWGNSWFDSWGATLVEITTRGGFNSKITRKDKLKLDEVIEIVKEHPSVALEEVKEAVKIEYPQVDYKDVLNNLKLQEFIARQIILSIELKKIENDKIKDEDDIEMMLLLY